MNFLTGLSVKDFIYGGIIIALITGGIWFIHHERVIGAQKEIAVVKAAERANQKKVDAINAHYTKLEAQADVQTKALSGALASANSNLASRMHHDARAHRRFIVPAPACPTIEPSNALSAQSRGSSAQSTAKGAPRSSIETAALRDDLTIALDHNLQLQAIIKEFKNIR